MIIPKESNNDSISSKRLKINQNNSLGFFQFKIKKDDLSNSQNSYSKSNLPLISKIKKNICNIENEIFLKEKITKRKLNKNILNINSEIYKDKDKIETTKIKNNIKNLCEPTTKNENETNKKLNNIKEISPVSEIHTRNLKLIKKLNQKVKEYKKNKIRELLKKGKSPMERFNNIKKIFKSKGITPKQFDHRRLELLNEKNKEKNIYNNKIYYYKIIYYGNCSKVIEKCLKRRKQWKKYESYQMPKGPKPLNLTNINNNSCLNILNTNNNNENFGTNNENNPLPNFIWSHSSYNLDFAEFSKFRPAHIVKMTNHFEFHKELSNKLNLFLNMMNYCENNNYELFKFLPLTFPIKYDSKNYIIEKFCFLNIFNNINNFISDEPLEYKYRNLFKLNLNGRTGYKTSLFIPKTHYNGRNLWLVKAVDLNRGKCIKISDNINGIESIIKHFYKGIKNSFFKNVTQALIDDEEDENLNLSKQKNDCSNNETFKKDSKPKKKNKLSNNNSDYNNLKYKKIKKYNFQFFKVSYNNLIQNYNSKNIKKCKSKHNIKKEIKILFKSPSIFIDSLNSINSNSHLEENTDKKMNLQKTRNKHKKTNLNPIIIKSPEFILNDKNNNDNISFNNKFYTPNNKQLLSPEIKTYQNNIMIIQKYIEKPLCYKGRKCDMRLWVLLTWDFNLYLFKEGHFKASSLEYDVNSLNNFVHLTNYSVQKYCENFSKFEKSNEISFNDFDISYENKINVQKDLIPKTKEIIIHSIKSGINKINKLERKICFEIFGYDFIFDENYNPFLLEVNTNPGLEISSPLIEMLIHRMIDDAFKLTIDKVFILGEEAINEMSKNPFIVSGYTDDENMWEFLGNMD